MEVFGKRIIATRDVVFAENGHFALATLQNVDFGHGNKQNLCPVAVPKHVEDVLFQRSRRNMLKKTR
jgi:hypothetical protein